MPHSITFGDRNSFTDWHLAPVNNLYFVPPEPKTNFVDIPGANGSLDLSTALTRYPVFKNREGDLEFYVMPQFITDENSGSALYSQIMFYLSKQIYHATLENDPTYYYNGRFWVSKWSADNPFYTVTIHYNVDPYKYRQNDIKADFPDVFKAKEVNGTLNFVEDMHLYTDTKPSSPYIITSVTQDDMAVRFINPELGLDITKYYASGARTENQFIITNFSGTNDCRFEVTGQGMVDIIYTNGRL